MLDNPTVLLTDDDKKAICTRYHLMSKGEADYSERNSEFWRIGHRLEDFLAVRFNGISDRDLWLVTLLEEVTQEEVRVHLGGKVTVVGPFTDWLRGQIDALAHERHESAVDDYDSMTDDERRRHYPEGRPVFPLWDQDTADLIEAVLAMTPYAVWAVKDEVESWTFDDVRDSLLEWVVEGGSARTPERTRERFKEACKTLREKALKVAKARREAEAAKAVEAAKWE